MKEAEIISALRSENDEFKKLEEAHRKLEDTLSNFNKKKYLSSEEEMVKKNIQKQKLQFKDRMAKLVRGYNN